MQAPKIRNMKITLAAVIAAGFLAFAPVQAHAFSLKRLLNPFNVGMASVLNPFHLVYKFNQVTGSNPARFIPGDALIPTERRWVKDPSTNNWTKYSWENEDQIPVLPSLPNPGDFVRPPSPIPPAPVIVTPPCQRGGAGITPC